MIGSAAPDRRDRDPSAAQARQLAASTRRLQQLGIDTLTKLRAVSRPQGDDAAIERFLGPLAELVDAVGTASAALREGRAISALAALQRVQDLDDQVADAATSYGLRQCDKLVAAP